MNHEQAQELAEEQASTKKGPPIESQDAIAEPSYQVVAEKYANMILSSIEAVLTRRITKLEGSLPDEVEAAKWGERQISPSGIVVFTWRGEPMVEFSPAAYTVDGWRDATVSELTLL